MITDDEQGQKCHLPTRKIRDPLYTTFQKIFTIIRIFLKSEAPKALYSSHSFIVSALTRGNQEVFCGHAGGSKTEPARGRAKYTPVLGPRGASAPS